MSIVINLLMVLLVALCLLMLLIILMQRPKQEGLGAAFGGGMMDGMLGSGTTNFLQKATVYLTVGYFVLTMALDVIQARTSEARSLQGTNLEVSATATSPADDSDTTTPQPVDTAPTDTTPTAGGADDTSLPAPEAADVPDDDNVDSEPVEETTPDAPDTATPDAPDTATPEAEEGDATPAPEDGNEAEDTEAPN